VAWPHPWHRAGHLARLSHPELTDLPSLLAAYLHAFLEHTS